MPQSKLPTSIASFFAALALAITLVAAGLAACCLPQATQALANVFSGTDNPQTAFSHDELVRAALATRDYTVGSHDRAAVLGVIGAINQEANTPYAQATEQELLAGSEEYTLDSEALSHLDDVYNVISRAWMVLGIIAVIALGLSIFLSVRHGVRCLGGLLIGAGSLVLILFAALGVWVVMDFNGFFAVFHSLFFAAGTWTFSYESLLITMYPTGFWMGMGAVWLVVSVVLSILAIVIGYKLRRR